MVEEIKKTENKQSELKPVETLEKNKEIENKEKKIETKQINIKENVNKKTEAKVEGNSVHISTKHSIAICNYIRGKKIDKAISMLNEVIAYKKAIPMRGEIPHRKGKGMMSGRFITKAVTEFIILLKSLKSNAIANELELEKYVIFAKSNIASRPYKRNGRGQSKRTHITLKLIIPTKKKLKKIKKKIKGYEKKDIIEDKK